jgi:hypothetical protein
VIPPPAFPISFIPNQLAPPEIGEARRELHQGAWRRWLTAIFLTLEVTLVSSVGLVGIWFVPLLFLPGVWQEGYALYAALLALGSAGGLGAPLVLSEWVRWSWLARRDQLLERLGPYNRAIPDPRWVSAQALLLELRGPDPHSPQASLVYRLTLALADEFVRLERVETAARAGQELGEEGAEPLVLLQKERDDAMNQTLASLKRACAEVLRGDTSPERLVQGLLGDLTLRVRAEAELEDRSPKARALGHSAPRLLE